MNAILPVDLSQTCFQEGFWYRRFKLVKEVILPYQWRVLNDPEISHAVQNLKIAAGETTGSFKGRPFQDSDVAKWLEAASYVLALERDPKVEEMSNEAVRLFLKVQREDGYLDTYFIINGLEKRWTNLRDMHELYVAGHFIEAAIAYFKATGDRKVLDAACKLANCIERTFGPENEKLKGYDGHPEIELALVKLYRCVKNERYLHLARFFVEERGKKPHFFDEEARLRGEEEPYGPWGGKFTYEYCQAHVPVREQRKAVGHAVRAMYLYCAMADLAVELGDRELADVCQALWKNVTQCQMYLTGGLGSSAFGEAFTFDYDLPNDTAYAEVCASIGLIFWAHRMLSLDLHSKYADVMERALYNSVLSGMSLKGTEYFYTTPLEVWPEACKHRYDRKHILPSRQRWFTCACCPPNLSRLIASLLQYVYSITSDGIWTHLYVSSKAEIKLLNRNINIYQETSYPWEGSVKITVEPFEPLEFNLCLRIPEWCKQYKVEVESDKDKTYRAEMRQGYLCIKKLWYPNDLVRLVLVMPVERIRANPLLRAAAGRVALQRGPLVFCLEEVDNGPLLPDVVLPKESCLEAEFDKDLLGGVVVISGEAKRSIFFPDEPLYTSEAHPFRSFRFKAVPYFAWGNRGSGEMLVWIREV